MRRILWIPLFAACGSACGPLSAPGIEDDTIDPRAVRVAGLEGLLLSEVLDHPTDGYKYVEICNRSPRTIDLTGVELERFANGSVDATSLVLDGQLGTGEALVVVGSSNDAAFTLAAGRPPSRTSSVVSGNGDDAYRLRHETDVLDVFGEVGVDGTGQPWEYTDGVAQRLDGIGRGAALWQIDEWRIEAGVTPTPFDCGEPLADPETPLPPVVGTLLISEVMDHADMASIKYVEICNRSSSPLSLGGMSLHRYVNGAVDPQTDDLADVVLAPGQAHVVVNPSGADAFVALYGFSADALSSIALGNGDDAYALFAGDQLVDVFGTIGVDGDLTDWAYSDHVALRSGDSFAGRTTWDATEWTLTSMGAESPGACVGDTELPPPPDPEVPEDPTDSDCPDADGDGYGDCLDCDDTDPAVHPGAPEACDGIDNDCDGFVPEGDEDANADGLLDCEVCDQEGLWQPTLHLYGSALRWHLESFANGQTCGWSSSRRKINGLIDDDNGTVHCVYTDTTAPARFETTTGNLNIEHTWPQSLGASAWPAKCDMHHLYPTDQFANSARSSHPFGVPEPWTVSWSRDGSRLGRLNGAVVFEPPDEHKGNVARSLFYMRTTYGFYMDPSYVQRMKGWHVLDPVDLDELDRTERIAAEQGTVNPLVACPHLVDRL